MVLYFAFSTSLYLLQFMCFMLQICGVTIYHSCIHAYHLLVFLCCYVSNMRFYFDFNCKNILLQEAQSNKEAYEITSWEIFVILIHFVVVLWWAN